MNELNETVTQIGVPVLDKMTIECCTSCRLEGMFCGYGLGQCRRVMFMTSHEC